MGLNSGIYPTQTFHKLRSVPELLAREVCCVDVLRTGSPLSVSIVDGNDVMSISCPAEPALVNCVNYVDVNTNQQNERINLSRCVVKLIGMSARSSVYKLIYTVVHDYRTPYRLLS